MGVVLSDRMGTNGSEMAAQHRNKKNCQDSHAEELVKK